MSKPKRAFHRSAALYLAWPVRLVLATSALLLIVSSLIPAAPAEAAGMALVPFLCSFMIRTFWFHMGLALIPFVGVCVLLRLRKSAILGAGVLAWTLVPSLWALRPRDVPQVPGPVLKVMSINMFFGNDDLALIEASIKQEDPDLVLLQEYTPQAAAALDPLLRARYPYVIDASRDGAFGQGVFSRRPFVGEPDLFPHQNAANGTPLPMRIVAYNQPQIRVIVDLGGREVMIQNTHLPAPVSMQFFGDQARWLRWLREQAERQPRPLVYAGDFNATQQSAELASLREAGLVSALDAAGFGRCATWPRQRWLRYAPGVRIDQFMSRGLVCESAHTGAFIGSDHLPIVASFRVAPS